jgi:uncharacterized protein
MGMRYLLIAVMLFSISVVAEEGSGEGMAMKSFESAQYHFGGEMGNRIEANLENWLLRAPDANPGLLEMFDRRDRHLPYAEPVPWAGEFAGKYLISAVQALRITGDERLRTLLESFVERLIAVQDANGYLGPWPTKERLLSHWDLWGHYHVMLGLLLWHDLIGDAEAFSCARRMGDFVCEVYPEGGRRPIEAGTPAMNLAMMHGMTLLYRRTGEPRYLDMAKRFEEDLAKDGDWLEKGAAGVPYYQLPGMGQRWESLHIVQGFVDMFRITGEVRYRDAAVNLWSSIRDFDRHPSGAFSTSEGATGTIYSSGSIETCCTVAWMALSVDILRLTGDAKVADEVECSLWNQCLGAQHPSGNWCTYDTPLNGVRAPSYHQINFQYRPGTPELNCCSVNAPRGLGMLVDWAVLQDGDDVVLNYYGPSEFTITRENNSKLTLRQETAYPVDGVVNIVLEPERPETFTLKLRIPAWSTHTEVVVDDFAMAETLEPGAYFEIEAEWKAGNTVTLSLDMSARVLTGAPPDRFGNIAISAGPLLLAYDAFFNDTEVADIPKIDADALTLEQVPVDMEPQLGRFAPMGLWRISQGDQALMLCDFGSAGAHGTEYAAWLPAAKPKPLPVSLRAPEDGVEGAPGTLLFAWEAYTHPEVRYRLLVARDAGFTQEVYEKGDLSQSFVVATDLPADAGEYFWKVLSENPNGAVENRDGARRFVINPDAPQPFNAGMREDGAMIDAPMHGDAAPAFGVLETANNIAPAENHAGEKDRALRFNNGMARYTLPFFPETDYTAMAWIRPENLAAKGLQQVFSAWCVPNDDPLRITLDNGKLHARLESKRGGASTEGKPIKENEWCHVAAVKKGNALTLYINGVPGAPIAVPEKNASNSHEIAFAANPRYAGGEHFHGCISNALFFARALETAEIQRYSQD